MPSVCPTPFSIPFLELTTYLLAVGADRIAANGDTANKVSKGSFFVNSYHRAQTLNRSARIMLPCWRRVTRFHSLSSHPSQRLTLTSPTVLGKCGHCPQHLRHVNLVCEAFPSSTVLRWKRVSCVGPSIRLPPMPRATGLRLP
jgi:hypothetical protein